MNPLLRFGLNVLVVICMLVAVGAGGTSQEKAAKKKGYDPTTRTVGWMFFKYSHPESWTGVPEQEYAIIERGPKPNRFTQHVPLTPVRKGLWAINMQPIEGWSVAHVGMIFREDTKAVLSTFESESWSMHVANDLNAEATSRTDMNFEDPEAIVLRYLWFTTDTTNSGLSIDEGRYVEYQQPNDWRVGSSFWFPLTRIGDHEFIDTVLVYENTKPRERPKEIQIRVVDAGGKVEGQATVPITVLASRGIDNP
ncbi:MAG: hypothetical protein R3E76_12675 [Planctomycetota bacterium]